jgi:hypothetical protein
VAPVALDPKNRVQSAEAFVSNRGLKGQHLLLLSAWNYGAGWKCKNKIDEIVPEAISARVDIGIVLNRNVAYTSCGHVADCVDQIRPVLTDAQHEFLQKLLPRIAEVIEPHAR